jgi:tRNA threonylcarbamoyladenosine biosynthesis protein TsaB
VNLLAFDSSTETLSLGLAWDAADGPRLRTCEGEGGRESSASLIPALMDLLAQAGLRLADLQALVVGRGPGAFTGLRTACAVAQGLAWGADKPVLPLETLMAVAEDARQRHGADRVVAALDARMDEVYAAAYRHDGRRWHREGPVTLGAPQALVLPAGFVLAGNVQAYADRLAAAALVALPTAAALLRLAPAAWADGEAVSPEQVQPLYVRDKVAQTTAEREAARQAAALRQEPGA